MCILLDFSTCLRTSGKGRKRKSKKERQRYRQTERHPDKQANRQTDRQTETISYAIPRFQYMLEDKWERKQLNDPSVSHDIAYKV